MCPGPLVFLNFLWLSALFPTCPRADRRVTKGSFVIPGTVTRTKRHTLGWDKAAHLGMGKSSQVYTHCFLETAGYDRTWAGGQKHRFESKTTSIKCNKRKRQRIFANSVKNPNSRNLKQIKLSQLFVPQAYFLIQHRDGTGVSESLQWKHKVQCKLISHGG